MPQNLVKKLAKQGKGSEAELEGKWEDAKRAAAKEGKSDNWAYTTSIFKNMVGASYQDIRRAVLAGRETGKGAGILFYAMSTGRYLLVRRSAEGDWGDTWACLGGGVEAGETILEGALRECKEEGDFDGEVHTIPLHISTQPYFIYHNLLGIVEDEWTPKLNDEHTDYVWAFPEDFPSPLHPNFAVALMSNDARHVMRTLEQVRGERVQGMS